MLLGERPRTTHVGGVEPDSVDEEHFRPINRIPGDVFSLIPGYCDAGEELVVLSHVCRGWRERFILCSPLRTFLDCACFEQTRVYLERPMTSPMEIWLREEEEHTFTNDAFLLQYRISAGSTA